MPCFNFSETFTIVSVLLELYIIFWPSDKRLAKRGMSWGFWHTCTAPRTATYIEFPSCVPASRRCVYGPVAQ